ncbi:unnamed protein product [Euphydryas editha]|uniref:FP protein C-terminal domain-containing protein n=1 Tax=Euphydryas editha TaxID=104508 RepID=A0AAU9TQ57_EUPED|nr:unnamed protein product [Euphydryas editha]
MPPKKTSPISPPKKISRKSDTNYTDYEDSNNQSSRSRGRVRQPDDEVSVFMAEIKKSFEIFKNQQNVIQITIKDVQNNNNDIIKSMDFISKQYEEMKDKLIKLETERRSHLAYIQSLEIKIDNLETSQKQTSIEIRNLPVQQTETKSDLLNLVKKIGMVTKINIDENNVRDIYRLNKNKAVVAEFSSVLLKEKILNSIKNHNKINKDNKLNTTHLQLRGENKPIYIGELLTQKAKRLFYLARDFKYKNGYEFCWTTHGKIFLRKSAGAQSHRIDSENDLNHLSSPAPPKL